MFDEETRKAIADGTHRAPGFVITTGYDRELAKRSVGPGWAHLIDRVFDEAERTPGVVIEQVKEKWAGLRIYAAAPIGFVRFLAQIEWDSLHICERCGMPGMPRGGGWMKTLCETHAEGRQVFHDSRLE